MAHPTVVYQVYIEYVKDDDVVLKVVDVDVVLDQRSKSKARNRLRAADRAREMYPGCKVNQVIYT